MLQVIAICSCISAVCLWCGFVSVCCPRIFNRISKLSGRQRTGCSRCPEDEVKNHRAEVSGNGRVVKEREDEIGEDETNDSVKSPSKLGIASRETINAKRNPSSLIKTKGDNDNEAVKTLIDKESHQSSKANSVKKQNDDITSEEVNSDREKVSNKREVRSSKQVDNYTSITSTLSAFSKTSNETSSTNFEEEKKSVKT